MKHLYQSLKGYVAVLICFFSVSAVAQLNVNSAASAEDLANAILGSGVSVSNVTLHCGPGGSGIFSNGGSTNIGLNDGILLTSGRAIDAIGPNDDGNLTFDQPNTYNGDAQLGGLISGSIEDVCRLEFDFVAESDFISVQYVFGSEEYNEYVCSQFNDVFGFFVTGVNPGGGNYNNTNVALVPSTNLPVSVNTINNGSSGSQGSPGNCVSLAYSSLYTSNAGGLSIQYDGFTVTLTAEVAVVPGETYHFKFAIADVNDSRLDSGVFIRSQSFSVFTCAAGSIFNESTAPVEFCLNDDIADIINIGTTSTATGDNYTFLLTNLAGEILAMDENGQFDLGAYSAGTYFVWGLSYDGIVSGIEVGGMIQDIDAAEDEGCFDISNPFAVTTELCSSFELIACAPEVTVECGTDLNDYSILGFPVVEVGYNDNQISIIPMDQIIPGDDCGYTIIRTWVITLGDLSQTCTQVIHVVDTQGPVFGELSDVYVQCLEEVPALLDLTAIDACSGEADADGWQSQTGEPEAECVLSTAFGPGADWAVWLPVLSSDNVTSSANFVFDANGGKFDQFIDGTAHIYGTVVNTANANEQFIVDLWLENKADWATWSGLGRNYKNDLGYACADVDHINWSYYELVGGFSTMTGAGDLAGDVLYVYHMPADYYFGFQVGIGANNKNCNYGLSGWFTYEGFVDGEQVEGHGDVNTDAECEPKNDGDCIHNTSFTQFYRAVDACGHATIASFEVIVDDTTAPVFSNCPESIIIECSDSIPAVAEGVSATDNCSGDVTVLFLGESSEGDACERVITRAWSATDVCGNRADCVQTITIRDTTAPVLNGTPDAEITVECDAVPAPAEVSATDNCQEVVGVDYNQSIEPGNCPGYYTISRTWSASDSCDNAVSFNQIIHVQDTQGPVFDPYEFYAHIECNEIPALITATDNCGEATVVVIEEVLNSGGCLGVYHRVYRATDECGNSTEAEQYIAILDTTAPEIIGVPAETSIECDEVSVGEDGNYFDNGGVYGVDNCELEVTVTYSEEVVPTDDNCPQSYDIVRTWVAVDYCDNVDSASQIVHVVDETAPTLYIPQSYEASCDAELWYGEASAEDNCGATTITVEVDTIPGACPQSYDITRTFVATDECGNSSEPQTQTISVRDYTAPMFDYDNQYYFTYECDEEVELVQPIATDNCGEVTYSHVDTSFWGNSCYSGFTRIWTATDECNNSSMFYQAIYIQDTTAPVISGTFEIDRPCDDYAGIFVTATDNCNTVTFDSWDETASGSCAGNIIRHYTAVDSCGNASEEFVQIIHLTDTVAPVIESETADFEVECGSYYYVGAPVFSDNCDEELDITSDMTSEVVDCIRYETYTWTAVDHCNNSTTSTTVVTIVDNLDPWFVNFPGDLEVSCDQDVPAVVYPEAYDQCDDSVQVELAVVEMPGACPQEMYIYRTFRGFDDCGNEVVETQTIHIYDNEAPMFSYDQDYYFTYECDEEVELVQPFATDNCGEVSYSHVDTSFWGNSCYNGFTRVWTATDECNNSSNYYQYIYIQDTTAPVISGALEIERPCDDYEGTFVTAEDNCNEVTIEHWDETASGSCAGNIIRHYTAYDICENASDEFVQIIHLIDTVAPVNENAPENIEVECGDDYPAYEPIWSDNCDDELELSAISSISWVGCNQVISQVYFAVDHCGNESSVSRTITIVDTTEPVLSNLPEDASYSCDEVIPVAEVSAYDICDGDLDVTHNDVIIPGSCPESYEIERTFYAVDGCGNDASYVQHISVSDNEAPEFTFIPEGGNYTCEEGAPSVDAEAEDNCSTFVITSYDVTVDTSIVINFAANQVVLCGQLITRYFVAEDACGNADTASTQYFIYDNVAPTFDQELSNVYVQCASDIPAPVEVTATDNCTTADVTVDTEVLSSDSCGNQTIEVTYTAEDECGNVATTSYLIIVNDDVDPVFDNCPSNIELACGDEIPAPAQVTASDNCDQTITPSYEQFIYGDVPAEGSIADCDLITPVRPADNPCVYPYDWAMAMFGMPTAHKWYYVSEGSLVQYPDGSTHLEATMNNVMNPANGWYVNVWFSGNLDWSDWSSQSFPTGFKDDCGGVAENHESWTYSLLMAGEGVELTGFGAYNGSLLNLVHAPANQYFGFQLGDGANNYNDAYGFGGWFSYSGNFMNESVSGAGDFAFELDCCPDYWIVRQWTAIDCSGNSSTCIQTISFEGTEVVVNPLMPGNDAVEAEKVVSNLSVMPNPATEKTMFTFTAPMAGKTTLEVFDMTGKKVADVFMGSVEAGVEYKVDYNVNNLATGIYTYRLTNGNATDMGKLIISK